MKKISLKSFEEDVQLARRKLIIAEREKEKLESALALGISIAKPNKAKGVTGYHYVDVMEYSDIARIQYTVELKVKSLKNDRRLANIMERALDAGLLAKSSQDYVTDSAAERTYYFVSSDHGLRLTIEARVSDDSKTCRKIVTGERLEPVKQYALVCD